jgi:hypothetical protein
MASNSNFFDQFDEAPAESAPPAAPGNFFDQFDEGGTPIQRALTERAAEVADYQAQAQERYMQRQEQVRQLDKLYPELAPPSSMREPAPLWDPYINFREPPIAPREPAREQPPDPARSLGAQGQYGLIDDYFKARAQQERGTPAPLGGGFSATWKMDRVRDPETRKRILAQTLFPNDPDAIYRVGFDAHGEPVYVGDDNKLHKIANGTEAFGARLLSPGTAGALVGSFAGPAGAALGAAGAEGISRGIAGLVFDEPQTIGQNLASMGIEGGSALVGEGVGRLGVGMRNASRPAIEFPAAEVAAADAVRNRVLNASSGRVDLNLADATDDPFIKAIYQYGWRQPGEPSRMLRQGRTENDLAFRQWTDDVLNQIARGEPTEDSGRRVVNTAQEAMRRAQTRANNIADPYYHAAWAAHPIVRDPHVLSFLRYPGFEQAFNEGQVLARTENAGLRQLQPPDLRSMDYWLRALRTRRDNLRGTPMSPGDTELAGAMTQRINELDAALTAAYPELRQARTVYRVAHQALVEPLRNGKVGVLAAIDDPNVRQAAGKIFSDPDVSPTHIAETRRALEAVNPDAWNGVVRQWLASKWDDSLQRTQSGEVRNAPGKFQAAVFGTPRDEEIARAMLSPAQLRSFNELMFAAQRLASTPVGGSTTPQELAIGKTLEGPINPVMQVVTTVRHPAQTAEEVARKAGREQTILDLTNAILDPTQRARISVITRMRPGRRQAALLGSVLSEETAKRFIESEGPMGENSKLIAGEEDAIGQ